MDQPNQMYPPPDCIVLRPMQNYPQPNTPSLVTPPGNTANPHYPQMQNQFDGRMYGFMPYSGIPHQVAVGNHDLGVVPASNVYNMPVISPSSAVPPVGQNHRSMDQLVSSNTYGFVGVPVDEHFRGQFKRKIAEGVPANVQFFNPAAVASSSVAPLNPAHSDGFAGVNASYFTQHRGNAGPVTEARVPHEAVRSNSVAVGMDPARVHYNSHPGQGSYTGRPFPPASAHWSDQPSSSNLGGGGASAWNHVPAAPFMPGGSFNGAPMEVGNMAVQGFHETASSMNYLHPPTVNQPFHSLQHPSYPIQGVRRQEFMFHPIPAASYSLLPSNALGSVVPQDNFHMGHRHPPAGLHIHRVAGGDIAHGTAPSHNHPHLRVVPVDDVAIVDVPESHEAGDSADQHRDMRLDIEDMSYEELLALGEQIGSVSTGLSEETIATQLKTRTYLSARISSGLEVVADGDEDVDSCTICQDAYKNEEKLGCLDCGHEYHADCLKKWLIVKNVCPICKSEALSVEKKDV